jgi:hypothetical protein
MTNLEESLQLGHRSITSTAVYTALAPNWFKDFWRDQRLALVQAIRRLLLPLRTTHRTNCF